LGVRAEIATINWAVVTGTVKRPVLHASATETAPNAYSEAESLAWIRQQVLHIIETYGPGRMGVRYSERNARGANKDSAKSRCRVEGVVLEAGSSRNLDIVVGALNTFAKHSGSHSTKEELKVHLKRECPLPAFSCQSPGCPDPPLGPHRLCAAAAHGT
jgi:hypothetical protein